MTRTLVLVHGRAQQGKDPAALKAEWLDAWTSGLNAAGLRMPVEESDVRFPYYGDTLDQLVDGLSAADVVLRGPGGTGGTGADVPDPQQQEFVRAVVAEIAERAGITDEQVEQAAGGDVLERGPESWGWVHGVLAALDRFVPYAGAGALAAFTRDVYAYLRDPAIARQIDEGVAQAFTPGVETVVVAHSLGSVVAYALLRERAADDGWQVPLLVTVGSPLGVRAIRAGVRSRCSPARCPGNVAAWFNAYDPGDLVALYPLTADRFPLDPQLPAIDNHGGVRNHTSNRHGISGYLSDPLVAARMYAALTAR